MALSGSKKGSVTQNSSMFEYWLEWSATQSIAKNQSTITVKHYWKQIGNQNGRFDSSATRPYGITIDGESSTGSKRMDYDPWPSDATISTWSRTVDHNPDGTKTLTISTYANGRASSYGPSSSTAESGNCTASVSITLDPIPRAASLLDATNFTDETNPTVTYKNPAGTAADVQVCIADTNGSVQYAKYRSVPQTGTSYTFPLTTAEKQALMNALPSGKNSMYINVYLKTLINGDMVEDTPAKLTRIFEVVESKPEITYTIKDVGDGSTKLTNDENVMIKGFNYITASMTVTPKKTTEFITQTITNGNNVINGTSANFSNTENNKFTFYVKDRFGFEQSIPVTMTPVDYIKLTCNITTSTPTANGDLAIKIHGNYFDGKFGTKGIQNTLDLKWRIRKINEEYGTTWNTVTPTIINNTYEVTVQHHVDDYRSAYVIQARAKDELVLEGVLSPERVTKSEPVFNWGENNFDINVPLTVDNISGSNIFNNTDEQGGLEQGNYSSSTGEPIDGYTYYRNRELVEVEPNAKYVIAVNGVATPFVILHYDENQNFISESRGNSVFVVPNNCKYINFRCYQHYYDESWGLLKITISKADPITLPSGGLLADLIYPVGSVYMSVNSVNPGFLFGGIWEQIKDRFLLSAGDTYSAGATGGSATHTLTADEMPSHNHTISGLTGAVQWAVGYLWYRAAGDSAGNEYATSVTYKSGGDKPHNNMPPYITVYMWKRIA